MYLTAVHYAHVPLACTTGAVVDCGAVTHSFYSVIPHTDVPITLLGMTWFVTSACLAIAWLRFAGRAVALVHFGLGTTGLLYVLWLVYVELVIIHRVCEWCTAVHLLVLATFVLSLRRFQLS